MITKRGKPVAKLASVDDVDREKAREAIEWMKAFRKKHPLRGLKIKDLINEGRKC